MRIDINVLPDEQKEKIREEKKIGLVLKLMFSLFAVLLLTNAVLYLMQVVLKIEYGAARKSSEVLYSKNFKKENQLEKIFNDTNSQVANISKINSSLPNWARVLVRIAEVCPSNIQIKQLSAQDNRLKISGFSKTRDDFLNFQNSLKAEGFQFSIDISNLVASKEFDFDLEVDIPSDYLIRK